MQCVHQWLESKAERRVYLLKDFVRIKDFQDISSADGGFAMTMFCRNTTLEVIDRRTDRDAGTAGQKQALLARQRALAAQFVLKRKQR